MADATETTTGPIVCMAEDFPATLKKLAEGCGSVSEMARRYGVDRANLDKAIRGLRKPSPRLLSQLGATKRLAYVIRAVNK